MPFHKLNHTTAFHITSLVLARITISTAAWLLGFSAISDDDYARTTISQEFAANPTLDPSGTSWLPIPFWITGTAMRVCGSNITTAIAVSLLLACASQVLIYTTARFANINAKSAWLGTLIWTFLPVSVFAGAATVPELPTAALCASAIILLRRLDAKSIWLSSALILPATLSRYESWPIAACIAVVIAAVSAAVIADSVRNRSTQNTAATIYSHTRPKIFAGLGALSLACTGPIAWMIWNQHAHGDFLNFHSRVSAYWFAWHGSPHSSWQDMVEYFKFGYFNQLLLDTLILGTVCIGSIYWNRLAKPTPHPNSGDKSQTAPHSHSPHLTSPWTVPIIVCTCAVAALLIAQLNGGAPTHHPERPLLGLWAVGWIAAADMLPRKLCSTDRRLITWRTLLAAAVCALMIIRLPALCKTYGVDRSEEIQIGKWLRQHAADNTGSVENILIAPQDYGYFAILAAAQSGKSQNKITIASPIAPGNHRSQSPFESEELLLRRAASENVKWLVVSSAESQLAQSVGKTRFATTNWIVVELAVSEND
ncbi:MAG: glycosyltransferase family 39 protein [Polyangiaceae bacterium]|nr:glycosyltransferase family 39 protein [Polyangiaceae bacterium]